MLPRLLRRVCRWCAHATRRACGGERDAWCVVLYDRRVRRRSIVAGLVVLAPCIACAALWAMHALDARTVAGLRVDGERVERTLEPEAWMQVRARAWLETELVLEAERVVERRTRAELGASYDVAAIGAAMRRVGRGGDWTRDVRDVIAAWMGRVEIRTEPTLDRDALRDVLASLAPRIDRAPRAAEIGSGGLVRPPEPGRRLDVEASVDAIVLALLTGERSVALVVEETESSERPPPVARALDPQVIGTFVTRFRRSGSEGPRAANVRLAAEMLDGAVIAAGGRLSFNERVGPRTLERGYRIAHVIERGEMVDGIGGGVCQVASTLHAAAFLAGLPITVHTPHSRPSAYIAMGLDATVSWPDLDLVIENPHPVPVVVSARVEDGRLRVDLIAAVPPAEVEWHRAVLARDEWSERVEEDPTLAPGAVLTAQEGGPGFVVERWRTVRDALGERRERVVLRYPPTDRIVRVGPVAPTSVEAPGEPVSEGAISDGLTLM